jgi:WD40 repeat protein
MKVNPLLFRIFQHAQSRLENDVLLRDTMACYIASNVVKTTNDSEKSPFDIEKFLRGPHKLSLIYGESGIGKSIFLYDIERKLRDRSVQCSNDSTLYYAPILIELKSLPKKRENNFHLLKWFLLTHVLKDDKDKLSKISEYIDILSKLPLVYLLDGLDEFSLNAKPTSVFDFLKSISCQGAHIKIVSTCRSQYLLNIPNYRAFLTPTKQEQLTFSVDEYMVRSFTEHEINEFIEKYVMLLQQKYGINNWSVEKFKTTLNSFHNLKDLIIFPLLLRLILQTLPAQLENHQTNNSLTRAIIYKKFIRDWFTREGVRSALDINNNSEEYFSSYAEKLAFQMFFENELEVNYQTQTYSKTGRQNSEINLDYKWHQFFENTDPEIVKKRSGCPLRYINGTYSFFHKSFFEYFVANHFYYELGLNHGDNNKPFQFEEVLNFNFNKKLIREEPAIINFLVELLQENSVNHKQLLQIVFLSKNHPDLSIASANAITVVNKLCSLSGLDLQGIDISGADLRGAILHRTNLQGANLQDVWLDDCFLAEANLSHANLEKAQFGHNQYVKPGSINVSADSPCGKFVASVSSSNDKIVQIIRINNDICVNELNSRHTDSVTKLAYSFDGKYLVTASKDKTVVIWEVARWKPVHTLYGHHSTVEYIAISPNGEYLVSASADNSIRVWLMSNGTGIRTLEHHTDKVLCVVFSSKATYLASSSADNTICLFDTKTWNLIVHFTDERTRHKDKVVCLTFSPDEKYLISGSADKTARVWWFDGLKWDFSQILDGHKHEINRIVFSKDGRILTTATNNETQVLELKGEEKKREWIPVKKQATAAHVVWMNSVAFSPQKDDYLAVADGENKVHVWRLKDKIYVKTLEALDAPSWVKNVVFSPSGKYLASANGNATVRVWRVADWSCLVTLKANYKEMWSVVFSLDEKYLAASSEDKIINIWRTETWAHVTSLKGHEDGVLSLTFSPDGKYLVSGGKDKRLVVWTIDGWVKKSELILESKIKCLIFSPRPNPQNGHFLAVGSIDKTIYILRENNGIFAREKELHGHGKGAIFKLAIAEHGRYLISGGGDKTFRIWDMNSWDCLQIVPESQTIFSVFSVGVSSDGKYLAVSGTSSILQLWNLYKDDKNRLQCKLAWQTYAYLNCQKTILENVTGLLPEDKKTLEQWGAIINSDKSYNKNKILLQKQGFFKEHPFVSASANIPQINGLQYQKIEDKGHCLYHAIAIYLNLDANILRQSVIEFAELNLSRLDDLFNNDNKSLESVQRNVSYQIPGLTYQEVPGDGHCLFHAVGLHVNQDQAYLRRIVAAHLEHNKNDFREFIQLPEGKTIENYIRAIREGKEWADHIEIEVLMRVLDRPIIVIGPDFIIKNREVLERGLRGESIFVMYNGHNHYDAFLRADGTPTQNILNFLLQSNKYSPKASVTQLYERSQSLSLTKLKNKIELEHTIEIKLIMKVLCRPIIVIENNKNIERQSDEEYIQNEPIFVCYNGNNHYDAFILNDTKNYPARLILNQLLAKPRHAAP